MQSASSRVPVAQTRQPLLLCRVRKSRLPPGTAPLQPVGELAATSFALMQTCQPGAQRSATLQPAPVGFVESSPAPRLHAGSRVSATVRPGHAGAAPGAKIEMPGMVQPPLHPAMFGYALESTNPSRWPSAQPTTASCPSVSAPAVCAVRSVAVGSGSTCVKQPNGDAASAPRASHPIA